MMKVRYWLGIVLVVVLAVHFSAYGLNGSQSRVPSQHHEIKNIIKSEAAQKAAQPGEHFFEEKTVFSRTTIIFLVVALLGIVAFRRNLYS